MISKSLNIVNVVLSHCSDVKSEKEVLEYLKNGTLVGLLPVPHPIIIRKYQVDEFFVLSLSVCLSFSLVLVLKHGSTHTYGG